MKKILFSFLDSRVMIDLSVSSSTGAISRQLPRPVAPVYAPAPCYCLITDGGAFRKKLAMRTPPPQCATSSGVSHHPSSGHRARAHTYIDRSRHCGRGDKTSVVDTLFVMTGANIR